MKRKYIHGFFTNKSVRRLKNPYHLGTVCNCDMPCNCQKLDPKKYDYAIVDRYNSYSSSYCTCCSFRCMDPINNYTRGKSIFKGKGRNKINCITKKTIKNVNFIYKNHIY